MKEKKLNNTRRIYIERIALAARNRLIETRKIDKEIRALDEEQLRDIISFFGGTLENLEKAEEQTCIKKTSEKGYVIRYCKLNNYIQVIHELGHAFLILDQMKIGDTRLYHGSEEDDVEASLFARAFIMPRTDFERVVIDHLRDGKFSAQNVAKVYGVSYLEVMARGEELNIIN